MWSWIKRARLELLGIWMFQNTHNSLLRNFRRGKVTKVISGIVCENFEGGAFSSLEQLATFRMKFIKVLFLLEHVGCLLLLASFPEIIWKTRLIFETISSATPVYNRNEIVPVNKCETFGLNLNRNLYVWKLGHFKNLLHRLFQKLIN